MPAKTWVRRPPARTCPDLPGAFRSLNRFLTHLHIRQLRFQSITERSGFQERMGIGMKRLVSVVALAGGLLLMGVTNASAAMWCADDPTLAIGTPLHFSLNVTLTTSLT